MACAAYARYALSTPPLNATITDWRSSRMRSSVRAFARRSAGRLLFVFGLVAPALFLVVGFFFVSLIVVVVIVVLVLVFVGQFELERRLASDTNERPALGT